jgi:uncharacterized protein (DUF2344 family)
MYSLQDNYDIFRDYSADKILNITHSVIEEAILNKKMNPYPLDHALFPVGTFDTQKESTGAILNTAGDRIMNRATYSSDTGISENMKLKVQQIAQFEIMFEKLLNLRAGKNSDINIDSFFAIFREAD